MGVNVNQVIGMTFVIGSCLGSVAGIMVAANYGQAHSYMGFLLGLKAFSAAVLGGIGNHPRRHDRRLAAGRHRKSGRRLHRRPDRECAGQPVSGYFRLPGADHGAGVPSVRPDGRKSVGASVMKKVWIAYARCNLLAVGCWSRRLRWASWASPGCASSTLPAVCHAGAGAEYRGRLRRSCWIWATSPSMPSARM
jgi:hypothetical protein